MQKSDLDRDPDKIETDIERTRSRIEGSLDRLSAQFTPSNLIDRALHTDSTTADTDSFGLMVERARSNPLSAALIAAGLAGMILRKPAPQPVDASVERHPIEPYSNDPAERIAHNISSLETQADNLRDDVGTAAGSVAESVSSAVDSVRDAAGNMVDRVTGLAQRGEREARSTYAQTRYRTERTAGDIRRTMRDAPRRTRANADYAADWIKENPLPSGLFALALGATVATVFAAGNSSRPRNRSRFTTEEYDREAAARAAAVAATKARQDHVSDPVVAVPAKAAAKPNLKAKRAAVSTKTASAKATTTKATSKKTAPLLKTAPDTGSTTISPSAKRKPKSKS